MRFKKYIPVIIYLLLILGCIWIVWIAGRLAEPDKKPGEETSASSSAAPEPETKPPVKPEPSQETEKETEGRQEYPGQSDKPRRYRPKEEPWESQEPPPEEPYRPPVLMLASDLHYMSQGLHDEGRAFREMTARDDGKISGYSDVLMDALVEEAISQAPSALVLTGDITLNGERENHQELARKLHQVTEAGIRVLVIPGNHDINNHNAASYFGEQREEAPYLDTARDFYEIYHEFGYDQAFSRDESSLSYFYALDETHWMLMLDTCQYEDYNHVNGRLKPETLEWIEGYLAKAREQGISVLPAGHHNLLSESRLYTVECTMENHQEVLELFEKYELPLYISGHLHAQRIKKHKKEPGVRDQDYGIQEIVLSPFSIPPCQYGSLEWREDNSLRFSTRQLDVAAYARKQEIPDEHLLQFKEYGPEYMKDILENQVKESFRAIPEDLKEEMAELYGELYYDYCAGNEMSWDQVQATRAYRLWERIDPDSRYVREMGQMIEDVKQDLHDWKQQKEEAGEEPAVFTAGEGGPE